MLSRYEQYVKEHKNFDELYADFFSNLQAYKEELKMHTEVVGDLNALQVNCLINIICQKIL